MDRVILHSDLNNFYASVECLYHPELRQLPVAVCGDTERRHGIILAKNQFAKDYGVRTGEALWEARQKCPSLTFIPPNYERYLLYSKLAREIYQSYADRVESFGPDECWLGVTASVGVSYNKIFAKLASGMKKPNATTVISRKTFRSLVWPLPAGSLLYVGHSTRRKLESHGLLTIGDLAQADPPFLKRTAFD